MNGTESLFARVRKISEGLRTADLPPVNPPSDLGNGLVAPNPSGEAITAIEDILAREMANLLKQETDPNGNPLSPAHVDERVADTAFGNQIAYLHNEYNFENTHPLSNFALVTRITFLPIYTPVARVARKLNHHDSHVHSENEYLANVQAHLDSIIARSVHKGGNSFAGGKDSIIKRTNKFLHFNEPIITTLRSMNLCVDKIISELQAAADGRDRQMYDEAASENLRRIDDLTQAGASSHLSMRRDYALRLDQSSRTSLLWVRHHSHYQTITAFEEIDAQYFSDIINSENQVEFEMAGAPTLSRIIKNLAATSSVNTELDIIDTVLQRTAFDGLPESWANYIYGRYIQGGNFLVVPLEILFTITHLERAAKSGNIDGRSGSPTFQDDWRSILEHMRVGSTPETSDPSVKIFREAWHRSQSDPAISRAAGSFLGRLLSPLIAPPPGQWKRREYTLFGAAAGMAVVFSHLQNVATESTQNLDFRLSETIVVDFGMNGFERGRLLGQLMDFGTQRVLALAPLGTFRFLHDALDQLQRSLSQSVKQWLGGRPLRDGNERQLPSPDDRHHEEDGILRANESFVEELEKITTDLTLLDDLVDGGVSQRARSAAGAPERLHLQIQQMGAQGVVGFMSLTDFVNGRFARDSRSMAAAGRRHDEMRRRVGELSELVAANIQIGQNREQELLLEKVDRLTLFGITYYAGSIISYVAGPILILFVFGAVGTRWWDGNIANIPFALIHALRDPPEKVEDVDDIMKFIVFIILLFVAVLIGGDVFALIAAELRQALKDWTAGVRKIASRLVQTLLGS